MEPNKSQSGFFLIEVVIALAILSIALIATMTWLGNSADMQAEIYKRSLGIWSAENQLIQFRIERTWPEIGVVQLPCPQLDYEFICQISTTPTEYASFRRIEISVLDSNKNAGNSQRIAHLVHLMVNEKIDDR